MTKLLRFRREPHTSRSHRGPLPSPRIWLQAHGTGRSEIGRAEVRSESPPASRFSVHDASYRKLEILAPSLPTIRSAASPGPPPTPCLSAILLPAQRGSAQRRGLLL